MDSRISDLRMPISDKQSQMEPQTRPSTTFRSSGREKSPHWTNRFRKDFHDLQYDVKYDLIKGKNDLNSKVKYHKNLRDSRRSRSSRSSQGRVSGMSLEKYQKRVQMIKMNKIANPQKFRLAEQKKYSTLDSQGLCKFEFQKTIGGRLIYKSNHHLGFQHQTERSVNLNAVWHNPQNELNPTKMFKSSRANNKSHPFESYPDRKVFEPREQLDKFYDTDKSLRLASARTIKQPCKIDDLVGRKILAPPRSASLCYNQYEAKRKIMAKICSFPISEAKREIKFTRQVISPERGCYR